MKLFRGSRIEPENSNAPGNYSRGANKLFPAAHHGDHQGGIFMPEQPTFTTESFKSLVNVVEKLTETVSEILAELDRPSLKESFVRRHGQNERIHHSRKILDSLKD